MNQRMMAILGLGLAAAAPAASVTPMRHAGTMLLRLALGTPALAAEDFTFNDLSMTFGDASVRVPAITVSGSSLSKTDLQSLFNGPWSLATADVLSRFDAASIAIPEIDLDIKTPGAKGQPVAQHIVYKGTKFTDIKGGKVGHVVSDSMTSHVEGPAPLTMTLNSFSGSDYDLVGAVRFVYASAKPGEQPTQVVGPASFANLDIKGPEGVEVKTGTISTGAIKVRPLSTPLATMLPALMAASKDGKTPDKAETAKMIGMLADFYGAFSVDGMSAADVSVTSPNPMFQGASIKSLKMGAIADARYSEFGVEGLDVNAAGGHVRLGRFALLGMDLKPMLEAMSVAAKNGEDGFKNMDWHTAIPHLDGIVVSKVDISMPMMPGPSKSITLAGYQLKLGNYVGGIPTSIRSELDNFAGDTALLEEKAAQLEALGYKHLDLSSLVNVAWNAADKSIAVNEVSAKGVDMGTVSVKGSLGNAPRELFTGTKAQMQAAGLGMTLHDVSVHLENGGLLDRFVTQMAAKQHTSPDKLRTQWKTQAELGIPQILGGTDQAKQLGEAVATFIANPKSLSISAKAKNPAGVGFMDVMGNPSPASVMGLLDVTAAANN